MADRTTPRRTNDSPIARLRIARGLTQAQLADQVGCPQQSITRWERGVSNPGAKVLVKLSKALECAIDDLIDPD